MALNLPHSEKNARLIQKFASNTSLWELLRQFESSQGANYNFTQRGVPEMNGTGTGAGRLNYEMPVITVMPGHKEYGTFVDLQKTLSQLGFDSGSASLRLSFKNSGTPLEEAMTQISQYFKSADAEPTVKSSETSGLTTTEQVTSPPTSNNAVPEAATPVVGGSTPAEESDPTPMEVDQDTTAIEPPAPTTDIPPETPTTTTSTPATAPPPQEPASAPETTSSSHPRTIQVFAAPTSSTPHAALTPFNETDYHPSVDQLRGLQASYKERSKNTRLLSDKELEDQSAARQQKLAATASKGGILRVRLPDGAIVQFPVSKTDTAAGVYDSLAACLQHGDEPFTLSYRDAKGMFARMPRDGTRVFEDLRFSANELVTFRWDEGASAVVRGAKSVLSEEWTRRAAPLRVEEVVEQVPQAGSSQGQTLGGAKPKKEYSAAEKENKLKNLLGKGLFKRK